MQFMGHLMRDLLKLLGIKSKASTAYHPQTDGQTEHVNQNIKQYLRVFTNFFQDDWADWLTLAEFRLGSMRSESRKTFPPENWARLR
jgi:hypothetical protein